MQSITRIAVILLSYLTVMVSSYGVEPAKIKPPFAPRMDLPKVREEIRTQFDICGIKKPEKPPKLLVFWKCEGFAHAQAIEYAIAMYQVAMTQGYCVVDFSGDYEDLKAEKLNTYDALVLNNTTNLKVGEHPDMEKTILEFVRSGKGYVVLHGGADNFKESPALCEMLGGLFGGHPWTWRGGDWKFKIDDPKSSISAPLGKDPFFFADEIYQHRKPYGDRSKMHVLVSMDFSDEKTAQMNVEKQCHKDTNDYPVSWIRDEGKGRVFYTSFGHDRAAYVHPQILPHILLGTLYAAGTIQ